MSIRKIIKEELEGFKDSSEEDWAWANSIKAPYVPKVGDKVKLNPRFDGGYEVDENGEMLFGFELDNPHYGGAGFEHFGFEEIFTITRDNIPTMDNIISSSVTGRQGWVVWFKEDPEYGVWSDALIYVGDNLTESEGFKDSSEEDWSWAKDTSEDIFKLYLDEYDYVGVIVNNEEENRISQQGFFGLGYEWSASGSEFTRHRDYPYSLWIGVMSDGDIGLMHGSVPDDEDDDIEIDQIIIENPFV